MLILRTLAAAAAAALTLTVPLVPSHANDAGWQQLKTTAARLDNPLKGFVPFGAKSGDPATVFPHTMEWFYLPLKAVVKGEKTYDWTQFETELEGIKSRGHHAALRFYLDYPAKESGVPDYLLGPDGIDQSRTYTVFGNDNLSFSPDYNDPRIQDLIKDFAAAFGKKYDGDVRIGFITTGLVGFWGEQHTWPMNGSVNEHNPTGVNWMPTREVELGFYHAWDKAFDKTKLLNRYPAQDLADAQVGFHDDSFAVSTLSDVDWHFMSLMDKAKLGERWKTQPIGGEIQPPVQICLFDTSTPCENNARAENFEEAVKVSHVSWLMNDRAWSIGYTGEALAKAKAAHASLGYDLAATSAKVEKNGDVVKVALKITNRGVAPFYYDWPMEFSILDVGGKALSSATVDADIDSILPGQTVEVNATLRSALGTIGVRIPNTMPGGAPLKFANATQDTVVDGYLTLGSITEAQEAGAVTTTPMQSSKAQPAKGVPAPSLPKTGGVTS